MQKDLEKHIKLFKDLNEDELNNMLDCLGAKIKKYEKNDVIIQVEDRIDSIGIVLDGSVLIIKEDFMGNRSIVAHVKQYEMFAEAFVCAEVPKSPVTVIASEKSEIMWIQFQRITNTCSATCRFHSKLIENMMKILAMKNLQMNKKIEITSKRNMREKLMTYLLLQADEAKSSDFIIPLSRNELADYLYVDRSALSRELGNMRDEEIIEFNKNHFSIKKI